MIEELRSKLKSTYDAFVSKYGNLNKSRNKTTLLKDSYAFSILASLEVKQENGYVPADVLIKSNKKEAEVFRTDNSIDAFLYTLGMTGRVDMKMISEITDREEEELVEELGPLIYWEPVQEIWVTSEQYLSGNVRIKMLQAQGLQSEHPQIIRSLKAIREVQVPQIPWDLLSEHISLGERWVPTDLYVMFAEWLFDCQISILYLPSVDVYKITPSTYSAKLNREFYIRSKGGTTLYGNDLMEHAIANTTPFFTYKVGEDRVPDNDAIQLANEKIETIRARFVEWLAELAEDPKTQLVDLYNNTYNCYVLRKYDGSHLILPGLDLSKLGQGGKPIQLYNAQKDVIWRIVQNVGGIIDWQVGTGKTNCFIIAAHEMKRMGIRKKPCILALKANIADIVRTYRTAYPEARILAPAEADFEKKNRRRLFHEMKNNDWDCVIMTHDQFGKIPQSAEIQISVIREELNNLEADLEVISETGGSVSRTMRKGLENRKVALEVKMKNGIRRIESNKDDDTDFDQIGIDHLFIDEAHKFKNLTFVTRHDRVAGLGNTAGSQKALNMLFAIRTLQKKFNSDLQTTFLSGTPISNSLTEMYLLFKYLRPRELERQNIRNFDSWAAVFAKKTTEFEFSVTNQIIAKERFRHFIKVPELALFYNEIADYRTNKSINIDKPEMNEQLVPLIPTDDQKDFIQRLIMFAKTLHIHYIFREPLTAAEDTARMLIATNYAKKMSTDMRLIDPDKYDDHPGNKISVCCEKVVEFYRKFKDDNGTQLIFCDLGVPDKTKWNVYDALRTKLVEEYLLPKEEIAFIHDYNEKTRARLFREVNEGKVRVLIGSTDKAGTGVNVQQRVVAIHDLDIPWKPAELEQRGGRGARQGNWLAKLKQDNVVYRFIYAVEQSLDTYKFTLLKNKQTFIAQIKNNELQVRSIDEGSFDEATGMNFAEYIAVLSGDNSLLEKAKIDKKLAVLENLRTAHYREQHNNTYLLEHKQSRMEEVVAHVELLQRDNDQFEKLMTLDDTGTRDNPIDIYALRETLAKLELEWDVYNKAVETKKQEKLEKKNLQNSKETVENIELTL